MKKMVFGLQTKLYLPDLLRIIQNWLEDNIKPEIYEEMKKTSEQFSDKQKFESTVVSLFEDYLNYKS